MHTTDREAHEHRLVSIRTGRLLLRCFRGEQDALGPQGGPRDHGAFGGKRIFTERGVRTVAQTHGDDTPELQKVLFRYCSREATDTQADGRHGMFSDWSGRAPASSVRCRGRRWAWTESADILKVPR